MGEWLEFHDTQVTEAVLRMARRKIRDYATHTAGSDSPDATKQKPLKKAAAKPKAATKAKKVEFDEDLSDYMSDYESDEDLSDYISEEDEISVDTAAPGDIAMVFRYHLFTGPAPVC